MTVNKPTTTPQGRLNCSAIVACCVMSSIVASTARCAPTLEWLRQFGTTRSENGTGVAADSQGSFFVSGVSTISGEISGTNYASFITKYDLNGHELWSRQYDSSPITNFVTEVNIAIDGADNVLLTANGPAPYLKKLDPNGATLWTRELEANAFPNVATDHFGGILLAGSIGGDITIRKYDGNGDVLWNRQIVNEGSETVGNVATDNLGNVLVTGRTARGGITPDVTQRGTFVLKYDTLGELLWSRRIEPDTSVGLGVSADSADNVLVAGYTSGLGPSLAYATKFNANGDLQWSREFGSNEVDFAVGVATDNAGNVFVARGNLTGDAYTVDRTNAFVSKLDPTGQLLWNYEFSSGANDGIVAIDVDGLGRVVAVGGTDGTFAGQQSGGNRDGWIALLSEVPEPASAIMATGALIAVLFGRRKTRVGKNFSRGRL